MTEYRMWQVRMMPLVKRLRLPLCCYFFQLGQSLRGTQRDRCTSLHLSIAQRHRCLSSHRAMYLELVHYGPSQLVGSGRKVIIVCHVATMVSDYWSLSRAWHVTRTQLQTHSLRCSDSPSTKRGKAIILSLKSLTEVYETAFICLLN